MLKIFRGLRFSGVYMNYRKVKIKKGRRHFLQNSLRHIVSQRSSIKIPRNNGLKRSEHIPEIGFRGQFWSRSEIKDREIEINIQQAYLLTNGFRALLKIAILSIGLNDSTRNSLGTTWHLDWPEAHWWEITVRKLDTEIHWRDLFIMVFITLLRIYVKLKIAKDLEWRQWLRAGALHGHVIAPSGLQLTLLNPSTPMAVIEIMNRYKVGRLSIVSTCKIVERGNGYKGGKWQNGTRPAEFLDPRPGHRVLWPTAKIRHWVTISRWPGPWESHWGLPAPTCTPELPKLPIPPPFCSLAGSGAMWQHKHQKRQNLNIQSSSTHYNHNTSLTSRKPYPS